MKKLGVFLLSLLLFAGSLGLVAGTHTPVFGATIKPSVAQSSAIDLRTFLPSGYVTDGSVDYTTEVQNAYNIGGYIQVPPFTIGITTIDVVVSGTVTAGYGSLSIFQQMPSAAADDIFTITSDAAGNLKNIKFQDFLVLSAATKTSGHAFNAVYATRMEFHNVKISAPEHGYADLWDGIYFDKFDNCLVNNGYFGVQNDAIKARGTAGSTFGSELTIDGRTRIVNQADIGIAIHIGGGAGGVYLDSVSSSGHSNGILVDDTLQPGTKNRSIHLGSQLVVDSCGSTGILFGANSANIVNMTGGWVASCLEGIKVMAGQPSAFKLNISGGTRIFANLQDGIILNDGQVNIDGAFIQNNGATSPYGHGVDVPTAFDGLGITGSAITANGASGTGYGMSIVTGMTNMSVQTNNIFGNAQGEIDNSTTLSLTEIIKNNSDGTDFYWDGDAIRMGLGTGAPESSFHIKRTDGGIAQVTVQSYPDDYLSFFASRNFGAAIHFESSIINNLRIGPSTEIGGAGFFSALTMIDSGEIAIGSNISAPLGQLHVDQFSVTGALPVIYLDQADISEPYFYLETSADQDMPLIELSVTDNPTFSWDESANSFDFNTGLIVQALLVQDTNGIDFAGGSDINHDLLTVQVTGVPRLYWDEAGNRFFFTKDLLINGTGVMVNLTMTSMTQGSVLFSGASGVISQDNSDFFWDDTNKRLGLGTASPTATMHLSRTDGGINQVIVQANTDDWLSFFSQGASGPAIFWEGSSQNNLRFGPGTHHSGAGFSAKMVIQGDSLVGIGNNISGPLGQLHVDQTSTTGATTVLYLDQADIDYAFTNYVGTSAADGTRSLSSDTTEDDAKGGAIRIQINGTDKWIRYYDGESKLDKEFIMGEEFKMAA